MKRIDVVVVHPNVTPYQTSVPYVLESMQALAGGLIETFPLGPYLIVCNEEGKLRGLPVNFRVQRRRPLYGVETIVGTAFVTRPEGEDFGSLTDPDVARICEAFRHDPVPQLGDGDSDRDTTRPQLHEDASDTHDLE